jgi:hypothetical protein
MPHLASKAGCVALLHLTERGGVGPVLSCVTKVWRKDLAAELKWLLEMDVNNRLEGDYILFKLGMVF